MCNKDLEPTDDLCKRDRAVVLPVLHRLRVIDEDDKVFCLSSVVHLALTSVSTRHLGWALLVVREDPRIGRYQGDEKKVSTFAQFMKIDRRLVIENRTSVESL